MSDFIIPHIRVHCINIWLFGFNEFLRDRIAREGINPFHILTRIVGHASDTSLVRPSYSSFAAQTRIVSDSFIRFEPPGELLQPVVHVRNLLRNLPFRFADR